MKTTIVPAQITTVEDRVAGNLSFKQLLLFIAPVFIGSVIYIAVPPFTTFNLFKSMVALLVAFVSITMAVRIKGKLVVEWILIRARYNLRPRYFVYDKNTAYLRTKTKSTSNREEKAEESQESRKSFPVIATDKLIPAENFALDPRANFEFRTNKKGGLNVSFKEIK